MINYMLDGKVALVTGASGGIGRAAALLFAHSGAKVLVSDVNEPGGAETVGLIEQAGGEAAFFRCDVSDAAQVKAMVAAAVDRFGGLDCAFNNAGINRAGDDEYEDDIWARNMGINLTGVMMCMREEAEYMLGHGGGAIVNTSSINGIVANGAQPGYIAAKHGVIGLSKHGAVRWATSGIRVNAVCPGAIETPMTAPLLSNPETRKAIDALTPMGRMGQANEVAHAVVWLCSPAASYVTGHALVVDGAATII
jgi:NAD(P)-dependent dehydrogenase (short-subunit alcohol dehydrogenase family)